RRLRLVDAPEVRLLDRRLDELGARRADHCGAEREHDAKERHRDADRAPGPMPAAAVAFALTVSGVACMLHFLEQLVRAAHLVPPLHESGGTSLPWVDLPRRERGAVSFSRRAALPFRRLLRRFRARFLVLLLGRLLVRLFWLRPGAFGLLLLFLV